MSSTREMDWYQAGQWCPDYKTHDYIRGETADEMIEDAKNHLENVHPDVWSRMTSQNVDALEEKIKEFFAS